MTFRSRGEISLGDLATAVKRLATQDKDHLAKIAGCLGFGLEAPPPPRPERKGARGKEQSPEQEKPCPAAPPGPAIKPEPRQPRRGVTLPKPPPPVDGYISHLQRLPRIEVSMPLQTEQAEPLSLHTDTSMQGMREPIFAKRTERATLTATIAVETSAGDVDLERAIGQLINQKLLERLPRRAIPTLKYGVQLLLDRSESMLPYAEDLRDLDAQLKKLVGGSRFTSSSFKGTPLTAPRYRKVRQRPKLRSNLPILLVTDFGIGASLLSRDRARLGEWLEFAQHAARKNCPVVALIPHKPGCWPDFARANYLCIHWDRSTSAGDLRKIIGIGHRIEG